MKSMMFLLNRFIPNSQKKIKFYNIWPNLAEGFEPKAASKSLPDWYKKIPGHNVAAKDFRIRDKNNATVKKCIPFFDAMTSGYIIPLPVDLWISTDDSGEKIFHWADSNQKIVEFHDGDQVKGYPYGGKNLRYAPKFISPWRVVTPKKYSLLYMTPAHRDLPFKIIEGIVDTDSFSNSVNFPFLLNDENFEGMIPAGTPMVQIVPVKRENWFHLVEMDYRKSEVVLEKFWNLYNSYLSNFYKRVFWEKKNYK